MTVAELIAKLQTMPQDMMVVIPGYEGGYDNPDVRTDSLIPDANWDGKGKHHWYCGRHENYYENETQPAAEDNPPAKCVVVGRGL